MPIQRCSLPGGGKGWRYGKSGKCYKSRNDAVKQMRAIKYSQTHSKSLIEQVQDNLQDNLNKNLKEEND